MKGLCFAIHTSHKEHMCPGASETTLTSQRLTHSVPISFKAAKQDTGSAVSHPQRLQRPPTSDLPREASGLCSVMHDPQVKQVNFPPDLPSPVFWPQACGGTRLRRAHRRAPLTPGLGEALHHRGNRWRGPEFPPCVLTRRRVPRRLSYLSRGRTMGPRVAHLVWDAVHSVSFCRSLVFVAHARAPIKYPCGVTSLASSRLRRRCSEQKGGPARYTNTAWA